MHTSTAAHTMSSVSTARRQAHLRSDERFYLDLDKPLLVYQRAGGLVVVPFTIDGAPHVVTARIDPLDDDETVEVIPAYPRDPGLALAALIEALDAVRGVVTQARARGHDEAVRLCERAVGAIQTAAQDAAEARYTPQSERRQQAGVVSPPRRGRALSVPPERSRCVARASGGTWPR